MFYKGIDVAKWQGIIDWQKVKSQIDFAILKCTKKNNSLEESFERNYSGCISNGIPVGVYRYVYARNKKEAEAEAEGILKAIKGKVIACKVWLDLEDSTIKKIGQAKLTEVIETEAKILQNNGYEVGIYSNPNWYYNVLDSGYLRTKYPFWIAHYPRIDRGKLNIDSSLNPKDYAIAWQYSSKGKINGIKGNVDLDVAFECLWNPAKVEESEYFPQYLGNSNSIANTLYDMGFDGSFDSRKKIAVKNGINGYKGTYPQNVQLMKLLKEGKLKK